MANEHADIGTADDGILIDYSAADQTFTPAAIPRAVYISTAGHLKVTLMKGTTLTFENLAAGAEYHIAIRKIFKVGSTAGGIVLL